MKKAQMIGEVFKYLLIGFFSIFIVVIGYNFFASLTQGACKTELARFEIDIKGLGKILRAGQRDPQTIDIGCNVDKVYFLDSNQTISPDNFNNPLIKDSVRSKASGNIFVMQKNDVIRSFYAGGLLIADPYYLCFAPKSQKITFFAEGVGKFVKIEAADSSSLCQ